MVLRVIVIAVGHVVVLCGWVGGFMLPERCYGEND